MIKELEDYLQELFPDVTFGQIQDLDEVMNMNLYDTGKTPYFNDTNSHQLRLTTYIRSSKFENLQATNESMDKLLSKQYDIMVGDYHIVSLNKSDGQEPQRDTKNRYSITSTYEVLIEEV